MWPFKRKSKAPKVWDSPREHAVTFETGGFWGDKIDWWGHEPGKPLVRVVGWKTPLPREGDVLTCEMNSGKTGVWVFQKVEPCNNPRNMFFADVNAIGYLDEITFSLPPKPKHPLLGLVH